MARHKTDKNRTKSEYENLAYTLAAESFSFGLDGEMMSYIVGQWDKITRGNNHNPNSKPTEVCDLTYEDLHGTALEGIIVSDYRAQTGAMPTKLQYARHYRQLFLDRNYLGKLSSLAAKLVSVCEWSTYRQIYRFDHDIVDALCQSDISTLPIDALRQLPYPSLALQGHNLFNTSNSANGIENFCDMILVTVAKDALFVTMVVDNDTGNYLISFSFQIPENASNAQDILDATDNGIALSNETPLEPSEKDAHKRLLKLLLSLLGYIASAPDDIIVQQPNQKKIATAPTPKTPGVADHDTISIVGETVVRQFVKSRDAYERQHENETEQHHKTPTPHMRRAHWHHFWTGPLDGKRELICHWIPPTFVNAKLATGEMRTTINVVSGT